MGAIVNHGPMDYRLEEVPEPIADLEEVVIVDHRKHLKINYSSRKTFRNFSYK